jgi:hypothetical protein
LTPLVLRTDKTAPASTSAPSVGGGREGMDASRSPPRSDAHACVTAPSARRNSASISSDEAAPPPSGWSTASTSTSDRTDSFDAVVEEELVDVSNEAAGPSATLRHRVVVGPPWRPFPPPGTPPKPQARTGAVAAAPLAVVAKQCRLFLFFGNFLKRVGP